MSCINNYDRQITNLHNILSQVLKRKTKKNGRNQESSRNISFLFLFSSNYIFSGSNGFWYLVNTHIHSTLFSTHVRIQVGKVTQQVCILRKMEQALPCISAANRAASAIRKKKLKKEGKRDSLMRVGYVTWTSITRKSPGNAGRTCNCGTCTREKSGAILMGPYVLRNCVNGGDSIARTCLSLL